MTKKIIIFFLSTLLAFALSLSPVFAGFGVSPAQIVSKNLKPGSHVVQEIFLSRSDPVEDLIVTVEPDMPEIEAWIKYEPGKQFTFPKGQNRQVVRVIIDVPSDAAIKDYKGILRLKASPVDTGQGGVSVVKGARIEVELLTTEIDITELSVLDLKIPDTTSDADGNQLLILKAKIQNNGNVATAPTKATIDVTDLTQNAIVTLESEPDIAQIPPKESAEVEIKFKSRLNQGEYFGQVKIFLNDKIVRSERLVFKVFNPVAVTTEAQKRVISPAFFKQIGSKYFLLAFVFTFGLAMLLIFFLRRRQKKIKKPKVFIILSLLAFFISLTLAFFISKKFNPPPPDENQPEVKGEQITAPTPILNPEDRARPLVVNQEPLPGVIRYYVYDKPDINSRVIFVALEDQRLSVLEETSQWYRVSLPNNTEGWLPKNNIKSAETEER